MNCQFRQLISLPSSLARRYMRSGALSVLALLLPYHASLAHAATPPEANTYTAAKSLETVLQKATDEGFLVARPSKDTPKAEETARQSNPDEIMATDLPRSLPDEHSGDCSLVENTNIFDVATVTSLEDVSAAKARLSDTATTPDDMNMLIMSYLALGLGNEAEALSERREKPILGALSRLVSEDATAQDAKLIRSFKNCGASFKVWDVAASITAPSQSLSPRVISAEEFAALAKFPSQLQEQLNMTFAIYGAETGDFFNAERILKNYFPDTKYGDLPKRKDEDVLYLYALILQNKNDIRFVEILAHIAAGQGLYKTKAMQALAQDSLKTGRALPASFESDLSAIDDQYGDSSEGRAASLELIRYRADNNQFSDAINTAKQKFSDSDPKRLESVSLIGEKILEGLNIAQKNRRVYALNGYFHDPEFFNPFPELSELTLRAHESAMDMGLPELAAQLSPKLKSFIGGADTAEIQTRLKLASAQLDMKNARYEDAIKALEPIKTAEVAIALREKASLASRDRALVQQVFGEQPSSERRNADYLEFILQKGQWSEAKIFASTLAATTSETNTKISGMPKLPFSLDMETLNYLAAPLTGNAKAALPDSTDELDAMLAVLKSNTQVAKGLLNYAPADN